MTNTNSEISIIIPCYNEEDNIHVITLQIQKLFLNLHFSYECIFIDDGSSDGTLHAIKEICSSSNNFRYISFSRNFGHQKALLAGLKASIGSAVITMDADLQHPVAVIPQLLAEWEKGYDVVNTSRKDNLSTGFFKSITSALFYRIINFLTELKLEPGSADFRLLDRKVVDVICQSREDELFLRGLVHWYGFTQTTLSYIAATRLHGQTKYSLCKMMALALNGITSFSIKPLRLGIILSASFTLLSCIEAYYVLYIAFFTEKSVSGWSSLALLISALGAVTLLMLGIIGEYIGHLFIQSKGRPAYIIKETNLTI